jgi:hypothetical protein
MVINRIIKLLSGLSMLSLVVVSGLWTLSYTNVYFTTPHHWDEVIRPASLGAAVWRGRLTLWCDRIVQPTSGLRPIYYPPSNPPHFLGLSYSAYRGPFPKGPNREWVCEAPMLLVLVVTGIATLVMRRLARRWKPDADGLCVACGYDLRATPDRCPECGHRAANVALK